MKGTLKISRLYITIILGFVILFMVITPVFVPEYTLDNAVWAIIGGGITLMLKALYEAKDSPKKEVEDETATDSKG